MPGHNLIPVRCEWGVAQAVFMPGNRVYVIKSPGFAETADRLAEELAEQGYDVVVLNTGVDEEREEAERLLELCPA